MEAAAGNNGIYLVLRDFLEQKSKRDKRVFTVYQLAKSIGMPHSILVKLTHEDPSKRVYNPRIDTLSKIVDFFKQDGFQVSLDDFLSYTHPDHANHTDTSIIEGDMIEKVISAYSFSSNLNNSIGTVKVKLSGNAKDVIAFVSDEHIKPMFKKGSVFIVDRSQVPTDGTLVAVNIDGSNNILIRTLHIERHVHVLKSFDEHEPVIKMLPTETQRLIGVVVQVNAKT